MLLLFLLFVCALRSFIRTGNNSRHSLLVGSFCQKHGTCLIECFRQMSSNVCVCIMHSLRPCCVMLELKFFGEILERRSKFKAIGYHFIFLGS